MLKSFLVAFAMLVAPALLHAAQPNDIRFQQFDGLQWNWIELTPQAGGTITFDGSLQFKPADTNTPLGNIISTGYLSLSDQTNQISVSTNGTLQLDGSAITGGGGGDIVATNDNTALSVFNSSDLASAQKPVFNYGSGTAYAVLADASQTNGTGANVALYGSSAGTAKWNIGGVGVVYGTTSGTTNSGLYGSAATYGTSAVFNALVGELVNDESAVPELIQETSVLLLDNRDTAAPLIIARDNGVTKFSVATNGLATVAGGVASTDTTAAVTIAATGWTNTFGKNAVVYYDGTNITAKVYNNAGTAIYTNTAALSGGSVLLQPSGAVVLSGTGVNGRATPF